MKTLTEALKEYITVGIVNEGGNVWDNSKKKKKEYIQPTLKKHRLKALLIFTTKQLMLV